MKLKECSNCHTQTYLWKSKPPLCKPCAMRYGTKTHKEKDNAVSRTKRAPVRKVTGEYALFLKIYSERKGLCEITGRFIPFDVNNFAHILSKGAYGLFRLNPDNIIHVLPDIHHLYDSSSKEKLLAKYPKAEIIYQKKVELKHKYYNP